MSENALMWVEIGFNILYLIVIWALVLVMYRKRSKVSLENTRSANLVMWAFGLLAFGDTGHVGFRVLAYAIGSLEARISLFGISFGLVGLGALSTAVTVTFFYMLILALWSERFDRPYGWFGWLLFSAGILRLLVMSLPGNAWNNVVPPQPWSTVRNLPLMLQGLGVAILILRDARLHSDRHFTWIGIMILFSYACYIPVILLVQQVPVIGMLMIPKTLAYVAIGFIAYNGLFQEEPQERLGPLGESLA